MKTKSWLPATLVFNLVFILTLAEKGFAENPFTNERTMPVELSEVDKHKPDISMEVVNGVNPSGEQDIDEEFEDDVFYENNGEEEIYDPIEPFNRAMWTFNEKLYDHVMEPVARGYSKVLPERIRIMIQNFFANISEPIALVSSIAQNNQNKAGRTLGRFLINSTLGIGGLFDPADKLFNIKKVDEDIDQALAYHNVPKGAYIMLPILGPTTTRGVVGKISEIFLGPEFYLGIDFQTAAGIETEEITNEISLNLERKEELDTFALDPYTSVKDYYIQRREVLESE